MKMNHRKEETERLKAEAKELLDGIGTETKLEQKAIRMIYGFVRAGFLETRKEKGGAA